MTPALNKHNILAHVEIRGQLLAICATPIPKTRPFEARDREGQVIYPGYLREGTTRAVFVGNGQTVAEFELPGWVLVNEPGAPPPSAPAGEAETVALSASSPIIVRQLLTPFAPLQPLTQEEAEALMREEESFFEQPEFVEAARRVLARGGEIKTFLSTYKLEGARKAVAG